MHRLLAQQLEQSQINTTALPAPWRKFLSLVNETYEKADQAPPKQEQTLKLPAYLDTFPDLLLDLDADGIILDYKSGSTPILQDTTALLLGCHLTHIFPPPLAELFQTVIAQAHQTQTIVTLEYTQPTATGDQFLELRIIPTPQNETIAVIRDITHRHQAEIALQNQISLFENLVRMARVATAQPDLETTLQNVLDVSKQLTKAERGSLFSLNPSGQIIHAIITGGNTIPKNPVSLGQRVLKDGLGAWVVRHRQLALIADTLVDDRWVALPEDAHVTRSVLCLPLLSGTTVLGVLTLMHREPDFFHEDHVQLMQAAADQMSLALRNAQAFDTQREMTKRQFILYEVLSIAGGQHSPENVMDLAVTAIAQLTHWLNISISTPVDDAHHWAIRAASGNLVNRIGIIYDFTQGIIGRTMRTREVQHAPDVTHDPDYIPGQVTTQSELAVPLLNGGRFLGVLDIQNENVNGFVQDDILLAESLAGAVSLALDNARLYSDVEAFLAEIGALYSVAQMATRSLVLDDVLMEALRSTALALGFSGGMITLMDPGKGQFRLAAAHHVPPTIASCLEEQGVVGDWCTYAHQQRESIIWLNRQTGSTFLPESLVTELQMLNVVSYVSAPLLDHKQSLGTICLWGKQPPGSVQITPSLMLAIGHQVGIAISNARLHETVALKQSQLQTLIDSSRDGIALITSNGQIPIINAAAHTILNLPGPLSYWSNQSLISILLSLRHLSPAITRSALAEIRRIRQTPTVGEGDWELPQQAIHWLNLPVRHDDSLERLLVLRDVTEERRVERMREDITQTMVHDLRNPLTAIVFATEIIRYDEEFVPPESTLHLIDTIEISTNKMLALVNTIMDISRLESQKMPLRWVSFRLCDLSFEVRKMQSLLAEKKGLHIMDRIPENLPLAWADIGLIERVLQNLMGNAIKFTPPGGTICLEAMMEDPPGKKPMLVVSVSDTGSGISPEIQDRLFQKFATSRNKESGSGVGLAFCRLAVQAHSGRIWVESEPDQGSTFKFTLPIV